MMHILLALVVGAFVFLSYRQGLKDGMRKEKGEELAPVVKSRPKQANKQPDKWDTIMANINAYDGTPKGQKKVV